MKDGLPVVKVMTDPKNRRPEWARVFISGNEIHGVRCFKIISSHDGVPEVEITMICKLELAEPEQTKEE